MLIPEPLFLNYMTLHKKIKKFFIICCMLNKDNDNNYNIVFVNIKQSVCIVLLSIVLGT